MVVILLQIGKSLAHMKHHVLLFIFLFMLLAEAEAGIHPKEKLKLKVGSNFNLTCVCDHKCPDNIRSRSSDFIFYTIEKKSNGEPDYSNSKQIPSEYYKIINKTAILLEWKNIPRMNGYVTCEVKKTHIIDSIELIVDSAPIQATDFKCRSYDFQYLICSFNEPKTYELKLKLLPSNCEIKSRNSQYKCKIVAPDYQPSFHDQFYNFTLKSTNYFDSIEQNFVFNHFDIVIPEKPNITICCIKPNSVTLQWRIEKLLYKEKGLIYDEKLRSEFTNEITTLDTSLLDIKNLSHSFVIDSLDAYSRYTLEMRSKVATAENTSEMWSLPANITFQTIAKAPTEPPLTNIGAFYIDSKNCTSIYWQKLPSNKENGPNFLYEIFEIKMNGKSMDVIPQTTHSYGITYCNMTRADYEFNIRSVNRNGSSIGTVLKVPKIDYPKPRRVRSIITDTEFNLHWDSPQGNMTVTTYTVFRCILKSSQTNNKIDCNYNQDDCEKFDFINIPGNILEYTGPLVDHEHRFAVSSNYLNKSSGMVWTCCNAIMEHGLGRVTPYVKYKNSTTFKLEWSLTCEENSLVEGYYFTYCVKIGNSCVNKTKRTLLAAEKNEFYMSHLNPYSKYIIEMTMFSSRQHSSIEEDTSATAPSPPRNLKVCNITATSVDLKWNEPANFNGQLRYYKIKYNNKSIDITDENYFNKSEIFYTISNLTSYHDYKITVIAGTISDSEESNIVQFKTSVDYPHHTPNLILKKENLKVSIQNGDLKPSSPLQLFEIKATNNITNDTNNWILVNQNSLNLDDFDCVEKYKKHELIIRAINIGLISPVLFSDYENLEKINQSIRNEIFNVPENIQSNSEIIEGELRTFLHLTNSTVFLYGKWSNPISITCLIVNNIALPLILCIILLVLILILPFAAYLLRRKYYQMKDIQIIIPTELIKETDENDENQSASKPHKPDYIKSENGDCVQEIDDLEPNSENDIDLAIAENQINDREIKPNGYGQHFTFEHLNKNAYISMRTDPDITMHGNCKDDSTKHILADGYISHTIFDNPRNVGNGYISVSAAVAMGEHHNHKDDEGKPTIVDGYVQHSIFDKMNLRQNRDIEIDCEFVNLNIHEDDEIKPTIVDGYVQHSFFDKMNDRRNQNIETDRDRDFCQNQNIETDRNDQEDDEITPRIVDGYVQHSFFDKMNDRRNQNIETDRDFGNRNSHDDDEINPLIVDGYDRRNQNIETDRDRDFCQNQNIETGRDFENRNSQEDDEITPRIVDGYVQHSFFDKMDDRRNQNIETDRDLGNQNRHEDDEITPLIVDGYVQNSSFDKMNDRRNQNIENDRDRDFCQNENIETDRDFENHEIPNLDYQEDDEITPRIVDGYVQHSFFDKMNDRRNQNIGNDRNLGNDEINPLIVDGYVQNSSFDKINLHQNQYIENDRVEKIKPTIFGGYVQRSICDQMNNRRNQNIETDRDLAYRNHHGYQEIKPTIIGLQKIEPTLDETDNFEKGYASTDFTSNFKPAVRNGYVQHFISENLKKSEKNLKTPFEPVHHKKFEVPELLEFNDELQKLRDPYAYMNRPPSALSLREQGLPRCGRFNPRRHYLPHMMQLRNQTREISIRNSREIDDLKKPNRAAEDDVLRSTMLSNDYAYT